MSDCKLELMCAIRYENRAPLSIHFVRALSGRPISVGFDPHVAQQIVNQLAAVGIRACVPTDSAKFSEWCKTPRVETRDVVMEETLTEAADRLCAIIHKSGFPVQQVIDVWNSFIIQRENKRAEQCTEQAKSM